MPLNPEKLIPSSITSRLKERGLKREAHNLGYNLFIRQARGEIDVDQVKLLAREARIERGLDTRISWEGYMQAAIRHIQGENLTPKD